MKINKEWFIDAPWGKIALVSWGNPAGESVLLVHGRQDSAATFIPLLEHLMDSRYYVALDLPGHGRSEPMPTGVMLQRWHFLPAVDCAVRHLGWDQFIFMGHSMGSEQGLFYNVIYPGRIKKFIFFDPLPSIQKIQVDVPKLYKDYYEVYYSNFDTFNKDERVYTKRQALDAVMKARGLTEELAEIVLSRNLWPVGEDKYRLSWDRRLRFPAPNPFSPQYYFELFSKSAPPTLVISATMHSNTDAPSWRVATELLERLRQSSREYREEAVAGGHDVHLTCAGRAAAAAEAFLSPPCRL